MTIVCTLPRLAGSEFRVKDFGIPIGDGSLRRRKTVNQPSRVQVAFWALVPCSLVDLLCGSLKLCFTMLPCFCAAFAMSGLGDLLGEDDDFLDYEDDDIVEETAPTAEPSPVKAPRPAKAEPTAEKKRSRCQLRGQDQGMICVSVSAVWVPQCVTGWGG